MKIDEDIIKTFLFQHTDIPEAQINRFVVEMQKMQRKRVKMTCDSCHKEGTSDDIVKCNKCGKNTCKFHATPIPCSNLYLCPDCKWAL